MELLVFAVGLQLGGIEALPESEEGGWDYI